MEKEFSRWKKQCLKKLDLSKKGSVDEDISHLVSLINSRERFFTTSSCSGRIILIDRVSGISDIQKQNCHWLFVSHQKCKPDDLISALERSNGDAVFKFEPFVLHVQCRQLDDAQMMHSVAINAGFRNSGLTVGKLGKIMMAVRSTHVLEVPLSHNGKVLVEQEYIHFLTELANQKMEENLRRIQRFYDNLQSALLTQNFPKPQIKDPPISEDLQVSPHDLEAENGQRNNPTLVYQRRRKQGKKTLDNSCYGDSSSSIPELEDCLHLFT
ncbi:tRNA wybutosine-synthesizing protein 3 homolog [Takifugu rubripes]|uniref:tRNA wybutosine-synthesizing protein 3 homolog n=1 Tax=Takifugu rubripes TaxID=31033 RepID=A0A3B5KD86_TAKRU|nr:tRNA wybutosine-synthesizing protein 3 homolog [Takifugu rubripes]|eukprot:XP_003978516.1 PREDICTED: tRNA wybutosine-synthesizing protein 3 homolog [Takifugu rubripes]